MVISMTYRPEIAFSDDQFVNHITRYAENRRRCQEPAESHGPLREHIHAKFQRLIIDQGQNEDKLQKCNHQWEINLLTSVIYSLRT